MLGYSLNLTVVPNSNATTDLSYLTAWSANQNQSQPATWNIMSSLGYPLADAALVWADSSGGINVYPSLSPSTSYTDLVVDINGYFSSAIPSITTNSPLPGAVPQTSYSQALSAAGGASPYSWSLNSGALPPGISLNTSTGMLSGTPTNDGVYGFTVQVAGGTYSSTKALALTVAPALVITETWFRYSWFRNHNRTSARDESTDFTRTGAVR